MCNAVDDLLLYRKVKVLRDFKRDADVILLNQWEQCTVSYFKSRLKRLNYSIINVILKRLNV